MSLNCPTSPVYGTSIEQKQQSREAAKKRRGTPKALRDLLREKCRIRFREARQCAFQNTRNLLEEITVNDILRQELAELEKDVELQAVIYEEIKAESDNWFVEQLEEEQNYLIEVGDSKDLICPICQKSVLEFILRYCHYECTCGIRFIYPGNCDELRATLERRVDEHDQNCEAKLFFFVDPYFYNKVENVNILSCMCDNCDYFASF